MLFNSLEFVVFLPLVFVLYWKTKNNLKVQNTLILIASYVFYGWWDWRFLGLIAASTIVDFVIAQKLENATGVAKRKGLLIASISVNIGALIFFKYYNFFLASFISSFSFFGHQLNVTSLKIILPVGISFYTFQTLSYTIDVYRNKIKPTSNFIAFASFVSFFPQLVAGPIERAKNLLPQFLEKRKFIYATAVDGLRQILWGLFKKVVIADNCAQIVNEIYNNNFDAHGGTLWLAAVLFAFQIYGDFSGYSDIAIGTAKLFGINLSQNFAFPYFSRDIAEFWRRWHISLSTWFRDYVYFPIGGSKGAKLNVVRNTFIVFLVSGLWHGANWTFVAWGLLNAIYFLPLLLLNKNRTHLNDVANDKVLPSLKELASILFTFTLTVLAWVIFRSDSITQAYTILVKMLSDWTISEAREIQTFVILLIGFLLVVEWLGRKEKHALENIQNIFRKRTARYIFYYTIIGLIFWFKGAPQAFIYFQF